MDKYVIISPVKNEQAYLNETITSVKNQTYQPYKYVIVNDSSTDNTREIVEKQMQNYDCIRLINRTQKDEKRHRGHGVVQVFYEGYNTVKNDDFDYIVKLDGDVNLPDNFFERILNKFKAESKLGITSGVPYISRDGAWVPEKATEGHTFGSSKVYRKQCFDDIGGLFPGMGWDGIDHMKALMLGWEATNIPDLIYYHLRPMGNETGKIKAAYEEGTGCYIMGYHPVYFFLRAIKRMKNYTILGGLAMILGFLRSKVQKVNRVTDPQFINFIRHDQLNRIMLKKDNTSIKW